MSYWNRFAPQAGDGGNSTRASFSNFMGALGAGARMKAQLAQEDYRKLFNTSVDFSADSLLSEQEHEQKKNFLTHETDESVRGADAHIGLTENAMKRGLLVQRTGRTGIEMQPMGQAGTMKQGLDFYKKKNETPFEGNIDDLIEEGQQEGDGDADNTPDAIEESAEQTAENAGADDHDTTKGDAEGENEAKDQKPEGSKGFDTEGKVNEPMVDKKPEAEQPNREEKLTGDTKLKDQTQTNMAKSPTPVPAADGASGGSMTEKYKAMMEKGEPSLKAGAHARREKFPFTPTEPNPVESPKANDRDLESSPKAEDK